MTGSRRLYLHCGLRIRSELELALPELAALDGWDIDVRWASVVDDSRPPPPGAVIAAHGSGATAWYTATSTEHGHHLRFHGCGDFVISADLVDISVHPDREGDAELLPILLAGTVMALVLALRGTTVLHASAVAIDDRALAFVGPSGRGKSTLAALLCVNGARLVSDDVLAVDATPPASCVGGASELRLRPAAESLARAAPGATVRTTADRRLALAAAYVDQTPVPLAAVVIPAPSRTATRVELQRLDVTDALVGLLAFPRVSGWRHPDVLRQDFSALGRIADHVPVHHAVIPWGPPFRPEVAEALALLVGPPVRRGT